MSETKKVEVLEGKLDSEPLRTVVSQLSARDHSRLGRTAVALERVFAFFISLALAEAARRSVGSLLNIPSPPENMSSEPKIAGMQVLLTFIALLATLIPFYHGGFDLIDQRSRYYRCALAVYPRDIISLRRQAFWNFVVLYCEGAILFAAAMSVAYPRLFTKCFITLFIFDSLWVLITFHFAATEEDHEKRIVRDWSIYSISALFLVVVAAVAFWKQPAKLAGAVSIVLLVRTAVDYGSHVQDYFNPRPQVPEGLPENEVVIRTV